MSDDRWRHLGFREDATTFHSQSQNARVWTEGWVHDNAFCPACGATAFRKLPNNSPVADFSCDDCSEQFELKSQSTRFGTRVVDGAYKTMTERLLARDNPNLLLMRYDRTARSVTDLICRTETFLHAIDNRTAETSGPNRATRRLARLQHPPQRNSQCGTHLAREGSSAARAAKNSASVEGHAIPS